jgi:hypothetical protein
MDNGFGVLAKDRTKGLLGAPKPGPVRHNNAIETNMLASAAAQREREDQQISQTPGHGNRGATAPNIQSDVGLGNYSLMEAAKTFQIGIHYNRQVHDGMSDSEEITRDADRRRAAGEPMSALPSPAAQIKDPYEITPSTALIVRPLQPEHSMSETDKASLAAKSTYTENFPPNAVQRGSTGVDLAPKDRPQRDILVQATAPAHAKTEETQQRSQILYQKLQSGPLPGIFKDEGPSFGFQRHVSQDSSNHHPIRPGGSRISDLSQRTSLLGQPREKVSTPSQISSTRGLLPMDKYGPHVAHAQHSRSGSLAVPLAPLTLQDDRQLASFRRLDNYPQQQSSMSPHPQLPTSMPFSGGILSRSDSGSAGPAPEKSEPAPPKRSTLMNLLNDDPPEPQLPKSASLGADYYNERWMDQFDPRQQPGSFKHQQCSFYLHYTIAEDRSGTTDEVMSKRLAPLVDRHHRSKNSVSARKIPVWKHEELTSDDCSPNRKTPVGNTLNTLAYIRNVNEKVDAWTLREVLERYGELRYFDVSRTRVC